MRIHRHRQTQAKALIPQFRINEKIVADEVRLIEPDGTFGVMSVAEALKKAEEYGLDLVEVSPKAVPPVCKILEFGAFKYQKEKEAKKQRAASSEVEIKGIRLSLRIGDNDRNIRLKQAKGFLEKGKKIRVELILRGREKGYRDRAEEVMKQFVELLKSDFDIRVESDLKNQNGRLQMLVSRSS